jgi:hypothetical protein
MYRISRGIPFGIGRRASDRGSTAAPEWHSHFGWSADHA